MVCWVSQSDDAVRKNLIYLPLANQQPGLISWFDWSHTGRVCVNWKKRRGPAGPTFDSVDADESQTKHFMSMHISPVINTYVLL